MYERVLIPLDGSEPAEAILPFAEQIAGPLDAELLLVRVVEPLSPIAALGTAEVVAADALFFQQAKAKRYLEDVAERLADKGLRVRTVLGLGGPAGEIVATAQAQKADLIAMTTHGRSGLGRVVFGSVAEAVLRSAAVPVLLFRMTAKSAAPPAEAITS
jgi:nucleotide-binding universal stress UspA family protein